MNVNDFINSSFYNGRAEVTLKGETFYINKTGKRIEK